MKQNNANFGLFVGFQTFESIVEICRIVLKRIETFQLFFEGDLELLMYRWENAFLKIQNKSNLDKNVSKPWRFWLWNLTKKKLGDPLTGKHWIVTNFRTGKCIYSDGMINYDVFSNYIPIRAPPTTRILPESRLIGWILIVDRVQGVGTKF